MERRAFRRTVIVGGSARKVGKTALVVDLIREFPDARWLAIKITQDSHGACPIGGEACGCAPEEHTFVFREESDPAGPKDSSRYLAAGAARALFVQVKPGHLANAMPLLIKEFKPTLNVIVESNAVMEFLQPALCLMVLDSNHPELKPSARRFIQLVDALVLRSSWPAGGSPLAGLPGIPPGPVFIQRFGDRLPDSLREMVKSKLFNS